MVFGGDPNENLTGQANQNGNSKMSSSQNGKVTNGQKVSPDSVIGEYSQKAYDSMNQSKIPGTMKDMVKNYFSNLK